MRNAVICTILILFLVLTGATIYSIEGKTTRQNELDANLSSAMERSMEIMTIVPTYTISREDDLHLIADFIQNFLVRMNSNSEFDIEILGVDAEKGMLSVRATETFPSIFYASSVSATRTIILEDYENTEDEEFEVTFYNGYEDGNYIDPLKQVHVYGGSSLENMNPVNPIKVGYTFKGWKMAYETSTEGEFYITDQIYEDGNLGTLYVTGDLKFIAEWEKDPDTLYTIIFYAKNQLYDMRKVSHGAMFGSLIEDPEEYNGKQFKGWTNREHELLSKEDIQKLTITGHTTFTAVYE